VLICYQCFQPAAFLAKSAFLRIAVLYFPLGAFNTLLANPWTDYPCDLAALVKVPLLDFLIGFIGSFPLLYPGFIPY